MILEYLKRKLPVISFYMLFPKLLLKNSATLVILKLKTSLLEESLSLIVVQTLIASKKILYPQNIAKK